MSTQPTYEELAQRIITLEEELRSFRQTSSQIEQSRNALERLQIHADRLVSLGEMASAMAHELNQPLTIISVLAQGWKLLGKRGCLSPERVIKDVDRTVENVERLAAVIEHVHVLANMDHRPVEVDINEIVHQALSLCRMQFTAHDIRLETQLTPDLPPVTAVSVELEQVLLNLLSNARYAVKKRKSREGAAYRASVQIRTTTTGHTVHIFVTDNGGGVEIDNENCIFEPFFTTKNASERSSLGLCIGKLIAERHGGGLTLHNRPGEEATLEFWLPVPQEHTGEVDEALGRDALQS